jgi:hypothetical protein
MADIMPDDVGSAALTKLLPLLCNLCCCVSKRSETMATTTAACCYLALLLLDTASALAVVDAAGSSSGGSSTAPRDLNGTVVFAAGLGGVSNYRIPAIVQTGGTHPPALIAFAEARDGGDSSASRIAVRSSTDGPHAAMPPCRHARSAGNTWFYCVVAPQLGRPGLL